MKAAAGILFLTILCISAYADVATVGALTFDIPAGFKIQTKQKQDALGESVLNRWQAKDGRVIEVIVYAHSPKDDRGPIVVANKDPIEVAGQRTKLIETKVFFGEPKKAFLVYLNFEDTIYLIDSTQMPKRDFARFLQTVTLNEEN